MNSYLVCYTVSDFRPIDNDDMVIIYELLDTQLRSQGEWPNLAQASASLPAGSYTTFRTYQGDRVMRLSQHLRRLEESAVLLHTPGTLNDMAVRHALGQVLEHTDYAESRFRLTFVPPKLFISIEPFVAYPRALYEKGVWCVTVRAYREQPHAKSTAFIAAATDYYGSLPQGAHEGLMLSQDGFVLEGLSSNFFALWNDQLHTEQGLALIGVTQSLVLELAQDMLPGMQVSKQAIPLSAISQVSETFITSVSREIMPVVKIDNQRIAAGVPGVTTNRLMQAFRALVAREAQSLVT